MSVATLSNVTATVTRLGAPTGAAQTRAITTVGTYRARVQERSGDEQAKYERDTEVVYAKAYIAGTTAIRSGDTLSYGSTAYIVRSVRDVNYLGVFTTLELERQR